ncbi:LOW QUALITY PROTEIN: Hypothetical protein PHPALM_4653 [Phytophthora palmivora]|uniref:Uncharacterized protein n=1 Tax=Phytophthora palmivora TaxID=4796 RepID=A0A2P4YJA5_9STRA|nr:LOW QUALITY PROTEIN: Hypothetical protein PHPALM_4653 [Phytophthora palmivora]
MIAGTIPAVHRKAAKKPRTTYAPAAADPKSQQPSGSQPGAGLPAPASSVTRGNPATLLAAGASQCAAALGRPASVVVELSVPIKEGRRSSHTRLSTGLLLSLILLDPQFRSLLSDEVRQLRDRVYAIEIALGLGCGGQAAAQAGKPGTLEVLRRDWTLSVTRELHGHVDRRVPASALKELCRGLDALNHEVHGRMLSYEPQGYSYHSAYGYGSCTSSSHSVLSYRSYNSRGYQPVFHSQAPTPAVPIAQRTRSCFEERIVIPLKTPHVERRVNGVRRAMSGQDREGSNQAMLQLVALYRANHL